MSENNIEYMGDGVYAEFINGKVSIMVNDHRSEPVVFLEPEVLYSVVQFYEQQIKENKEKL